MLTYNEIVENIRRANGYWQTNVTPTQQTNGVPIPFWDTAAYHTGNMEAYFTLLDENYRKYSTDWAEANKWMGHPTDATPEEWTFGYSQDDKSKAALFGDWQICFQTYLDLHLLDPSPEKIARARYVIDYQCSTEEKGYWWWADALYMVMPVFMKMYLTFKDEKYLYKLYDYFKFAKELMYDGEDGMPSPVGGKFEHLFYRDGTYVGSEINGVKNFWARGDGWVFAGLAKVLSEMPEDFEHYDYFKKTYLEMAPAIIACQKVDENGNGFWTQSMLADYPLSDHNPQGYETSGTGFFTYGLFWGINYGILDENTYLPAAERGLSYLSKIALHEDGKVGYVQPIGSNATQATPWDRTVNFGVGAFLLAMCEAARYVNGSPANEAYLRRLMWGKCALRVGSEKYYCGCCGRAEMPAPFEKDGEIIIPAEAAKLIFRKDCDVKLSESGMKCITMDDIIILSHKEKIFCDNDGAVRELLRGLM
ncbi:MAG: glycoside hydrolase family 88 protein [Clostridia bacterium]